MTPERRSARARAADGRWERATLGGGCFWCLEAALDRLAGVREVTPGYAGGHVEDPTYREVCGGGTGHAEVVRVTFDPEIVTYRELLQVFFALHDPTTRDREGPDVGPQYRSIVLYEDQAQERAVRSVIRELEASEAFDGPVVTEVEPLEAFYEAEEAHHDYYRRNPERAYCRAVIEPKLAKLKRRFAGRLADASGGRAAEDGGAAAGDGADAAHDAGTDR
jgi:peptide-methionine (S)-S-oxide reductase